MAKQRRKLTSDQKREKWAWRDLVKWQAQLTRLHHQKSQCQTQLLALDKWLAFRDADNMTNPNCVSILVRLDAGFSTDPNLTWLIEMGYICLTKVHHSNSTYSLRRRLSAQPE